MSSTRSGTMRPSAFAVFRLMISEYFRRLLYREVTRAGTLEDAIDIGCRLSVKIDCIERIRHQGALFGPTWSKTEQGQTVTGSCGDDHTVMRLVKMSGKLIRPPPGACAWAAMASLISVSLRTGASVTVTPREAAAASIPRNWNWV